MSNYAKISGHTFVSIHDHTSPVLELAKRLGVSESTVYKYRRQAATASPWAGLMRI